MKNLRPGASTRSLMVGFGLIGLGIVWASRQFLPGLLLLAGVAAILDSQNRADRRNERRAGILLLILGIWSAFRFSIPILLIGLGTCLVLSAVSPKVHDKPRADHRLD